jgi:hypothetical protein
VVEPDPQAETVASVVTAAPSSRAVRDFFVIVFLFRGVLPGSRPWAVPPPLYTKT